MDKNIFEYLRLYKNNSLNVIYTELKDPIFEIDVHKAMEEIIV